jgi:DNA gyrase subunit B
MRGLIEQGKVYVAQPPLYSTTVGKETVYLKDDSARERFLQERPNHKAEFARLKGLGEMDWEELRDTTMNAGRRTLLRVSAQEASLADQACSILFGDDVESRKNFIVNNASDVRFLDI